MPTELEELVEFIHHGNTPIRQLAVENLVPYSLSHPAIFKTDQLLPVRDLKLLVRDYAQIAKNAVTILINLSTDGEILKSLAADDPFLDSLLARVTNPSEPNANLIAMLLANLAKSDDLKRIITLRRPVQKSLGSSNIAIDHLLDLFVRGADGSYNKEADFDYLAYLFADIAKHAEGRSYLATKQAYDGVIPLTKLTVFTEHRSPIRRKGVASTIKNVAFDIPSHPSFISEDEINALPYILLPLAGNEEFDEEDMLAMLPDLQLLPPDKARDTDADILQTHVETLTLLTTTRTGRDTLRAIRIYPIIREVHLHIEHEGVREACDRLVQVLMRDEPGGDEKVSGGMVALSRATPVQDHGRLQATGGAGSWARVEENGDEKEDVGKRKGGEEEEEEKEEEEEDSDDDRVVEV